MKGEQLIILNRSLRKFASLLAVWSFINTMPVMSKRIIVTLSAWWREQAVSNSEHDAAVRVPSNLNLTVPFSELSVILNMRFSLQW